jgi:hypothetical protein
MDAVIEMAPAFLEDVIASQHRGDSNQPGIVRWVITVALANTKSALAVNALINRLDDPEVPLETICNALMDLTRYRWCDVTWEKSLRRGWTQWWKTNGRKVRLFSAADGCPNFPELLPQIR